ncbi:hypothetical protein HRG_005716 [Hirsutella rhossiliensis]|uniref:Uncharacterized protein n=1 Tax=Hirsutella rhossiliensis TaxID=111463 RepID=A0A9P8MZN6_9HYPO|nr:uncharacterized protein HRG_05716 [Hirsutella rhossiliensis]KAH0963206.1 hypothetical protein HRG_05716 [Hirsutella rhossiliensis]
MRSDTPGSANRQIPLLCTVCPETPRFSDVSHLLTHIASKGHLHHETQTRLKSHQDLEASVVMDQYENWYKDNGIEALLVERMKAKQLKEAAKTRRARGVTPFPAPKTKRRTKRLGSGTAVKSEQEEFAQEYPLFPGFFASDYDAEHQDDLFPSNDTLSLKGQVWPGMGKMDLANEDMRRTRNQRKPNSVIEKMRRVSEGIEPTQVVMTSDFEVERVKGVYDGSSPIPGQEEEETPKKAGKPKRKRTEALADISANVPRGAIRRPGRSTLARSNRVPHIQLEYDCDTSSEQSPSLGGFRNGHDIFQDDDGGPGIYEDRSFATPTHQDRKFDTRDRLGLHALNPISHSNVVSPTPSRDLSTRSLANVETSYGLTDATMYGGSARLSFAGNSHFGALSQDNFRLNPNNLPQAKHGDYSSGAGDSLSNPGNNQFLTMSESNPLFSHDRMFLTSFSQPHTSQAMSSFSFTPINRGRDHSRAVHDHEQRATGPNIKVEAHMCDDIENTPSSDVKQSTFTLNGIWDAQPTDNGVESHEDLGEQELDI